MVIDAYSSPRDSRVVIESIRESAPLLPVLALVDDVLQHAPVRNDVDGEVTVGDFSSGRFMQLIESCGDPASAQSDPEDQSMGDKAGYFTAENQNTLLSSLNRIAIEMMNRAELSALMQSIADNTGELTNADYAYVALVHESGKYMETVAANTDDYQLSSVRHRPGFGIGGQAWLKGETVCVADYQNYPHRLAGVSTGKQACTVPLKLDNEVIGVVGILYESNDNDINRQSAVLVCLLRWCPLR